MDFSRIQKFNELKKEFAVFEMETGESLESVMSRYSMLVREMKQIGFDHRELDYVNRLADTLVEASPEKWGDYIVSLLSDPNAYTALNLS